MLFEPAFGMGEIGAEPGDLAPEAVGMIHLPQMYEFVQEDVIADEERGLNEAPVEGNGAAA